MHTPVWQTSVRVQELPSSHAVPFGAVGFEQCPVNESQAPTTWHGSDAEHTTGLPPLHTPDWQASVWVHALPSLQAVPFGAAGFEQWPVDESQVPATWHASEALHTTLAPAHTPVWQVSVWVHALPSLQAVPFGAAGFEQWPVDESQVPAMWHPSEAVQTTELPPMHAPAWQVSV